LRRAERPIAVRGGFRRGVRNKNYGEGQGAMKHCGESGAFLKAAEGGGNVAFHRASLARAAEDRRNAHPTAKHPPNAIFCDAVVPYAQLQRDHMLDAIKPEK